MHFACCFRNNCCSGTAKEKELHRHLQRVLRHERSGASAGECESSYLRISLMSTIIAAQMANRTLSGDGPLGGGLRLCFFPHQTRRRCVAANIDIRRATDCSELGIGPLQRESGIVCTNCTAKAPQRRIAQLLRLTFCCGDPLQARNNAAPNKKAFKQKPTKGSKKRSEARRKNLMRFRH